MDDVTLERFARATFATRPIPGSDCGERMPDLDKWRSAAPSLKAAHLDKCKLVMAFVSRAKA